MTVLGKKGLILDTLWVPLVSNNRCMHFHKGGIFRKAHREEYVRKQIAETEIEVLGTQDKEHRIHQM